MAAWYRFKDWPLRAKLTVLLLTASLLPLGVATWISVRNASNDEYANRGALLAARAELLVGRIDTFNRGYQLAVRRMALVPDLLELLQASPGERERRKPGANAVLNAWPVSDASIRGVAVLDATGAVVVGTEGQLVGRNLAYRSFVQQALRGADAISDVFLAEPEVGGAATIAFASPLWGPDQRVIGVAVFWVHGTALRDLLRQANETAGPGSFAMLFDRLGIRIGHSFRDELVFRPGRNLDETTIAALIAERRFGERTRATLEDVQPASPEFQLGAELPPGPSAFRGFAPGDQQWNYVVGRRCETVAWTAYVLIPERVLQTEISRIVRQKLQFAAVIMFAALLLGALFGRAILRPIGRLSAGARALGAGDMDARVDLDREDELGELGATFNSMAARIQEQSAALLRESEAQYRRLFETLTEGFCTLDVLFDDHSNPVDFEFVEINASFEAQSGLSAVRGKRIRELLPDIEEYWIQLYGRVAQTGQPVHVEHETRMLGRHHDVRAYRVGGPSSRRVAVLFNDITERRDAQRRLQAQLERLDLLQQITRAIGERQDLPSICQVVVRALEDRLPVDFGLICLYEPDQQRLLVSRVGMKSQPLARDLGLLEDSHIPIDENGLSRCVRGQLVYEPDVVAVQFPFPQRLAGGGLRALVAAPLLMESHVFGVLIAARRDPDSFSSGECEFLRHLSEHVALAAHHAQLYGALQSAYEDLRQTQHAVLQQERLRALGQMASGIAHDINNAISPVALYTDSLLEREHSISEQGRGQLETIQRAVHDVAATVARLREFYRQREPQLMLVPVQLNELVPQVAELTRARWADMAQQRGLMIDLHMELRPGLPEIPGSESEIREALTNLVLNAVDAMPEGGTLTLRTRVAASGAVEVEVSDTGFGMDEDLRRRCLEPFYTTKGERGTGLGLAMVYGVARRHNAEIEIDSTPGQGTTMRLRFLAMSGTVAAAEIGTLPILAGLRLLVIDDDPVLLRSLRDTLEEDGHRVTAAGGGQEGIDLFRASITDKQVFAAVFTDLGMPYVNGRQVAKALKAQSPATPVIMLTGWGERLVSEGDVPEEVDLVLSKPPKLRQLREALARCCAGARS